MSKILDGLNENQKLAVQHEDGACCVVASAGSGKSTVLVSRVQYLIESGVNPNGILTFTFTKKAGEELKEKLQNQLGDKAKGVTVGTFHSVYYAILRDYQARKDGFGSRKLDLAPDWWKEKTVTEIMNKMYIPKEVELDAKSVLSIISDLKNNLKSQHDRFDLPDNMQFMEEIIGEIYLQYEAKKDAENKIDFEDMIFKVYQAFKEDNSFLQIYRNKFQYISIDEFQDSNTLNDAVVSLMVNDKKNIFVVGDPRQSIYAFLQSRVDIILDFQKRWDARLIELDINYRCSKDIVESSNNLISHSKQTIGGDAKANKPSNVKPTLFTSESEFDEASAVAREIEQIVSEGKYDYKDITILYRTNASSQPFEDEFMESEIPYIVIGSLTFYDRREIKDIVSYLQLAKNPHNDEAMLEIINRPNRFLGKVFIGEITDYARGRQCSIYSALKQSPLCSQWRYKKGTSELVSIINELSNLHKQEKSITEIISTMQELASYGEFLQKESKPDAYSDKLENIETLIASTSKFQSLDKFLEYVDLMKEKQKEEENNKDSNKVKLMSIHKSKGSEFPIVFIAGVSYKQLPFYREQYADSLNMEEERRLMYVAMTRAEDLLYVSNIKSYRGDKVRVSPFIREMKIHKRDKDAIK